jgi:hypothetical protein
MGERGNWIQTFTGKRFYVLDPREEEVCIEDIAHALSNLCRFTGHVREFYSVAQHSLHVSELCPEELALQGLLHDASEAYLNDLNRPLKRSEELRGYREIEARVQEVIARAFGLPGGRMPVAVKQADDLALAGEAQALMAPLLSGWGKYAAPTATFIMPPLLPKQAETLFLRRFSLLTHPRVGRVA